MSCSESVEVNNYCVMMMNVLYRKHLSSDRYQLYPQEHWKEHFGNLHRFLHSNLAGPGFKRVRAPIIRNICSTPDLGSWILTNQTAVAFPACGGFTLTYNLQEKLIASLSRTRQPVINYAFVNSPPERQRRLTGC
jgi:hypothetical protein